MENELIISTPNSYETLTNCLTYEFNRRWKNNLKSNNKNLIWGIVFLFFAILFYFLNDSTIPFFLLGFAVASISYYFNYKSLYKKNKIHFEKILSNEVQKLNQSSKDVLWEFSPKYFKFSNYNSWYQFLWETITYFVLEEKYLYITANNGLNFILDKNNVSEVHFAEILAYLKSKSELKEPI